MFGMIAPPRCEECLARFRAELSEHLARVLKPATVDPQTLATEFAIVMRENVSLGTLAEIDRLNLAESDPIVCHSHDFTDANQHMADALARFNLDVSSEHFELIGRAWSIARAAGFAGFRTVGVVNVSAGKIEGISNEGLAPGRYAVAISDGRLTLYPM